MMTTLKTPKALREVWEWKDAVYEDTKDLTCGERKEYYRYAVMKAAAELQAEMVQEPDGTWRMVRRNVP